MSPTDEAPCMIRLEKRPAALAGLDLGHAARGGRC